MCVYSTLGLYSTPTILKLLSKAGPCKASSIPLKEYYAISGSCSLFFFFKAADRVLILTLINAQRFDFVPAGKEKVNQEDAKDGALQSHQLQYLITGHSCER